jgi:hypothetical protein
MAATVTAGSYQTAAAPPRRIEEALLNSAEALGRVVPADQREVVRGISG